MSRIAEIRKIQKELSDEIRDIQESCKHHNYIIGSYSWRIGSSDLKRICVDCESILGDPSDEEVSDYNLEMEDRKKEGKPTGQGTKVYTI